MYQYRADLDCPRLEFYGEDAEMVKKITDPKIQSEAFRNLNSASESIWSLSSRWCEERNIVNGELLPTKVSNVIPVDLNAIIQQGYSFLRSWNRKLGDTQRAAHYKTLSKDLLLSIEMVLWNKEESIWNDYDIEEGKPRNSFYLSNLAPLWTQSFSKTKWEMTSSVLDYLYKNDIYQYRGGIPVTKLKTGTRWDLPHCNPGLQASVADGLRNLGTPEGKSEAVLLVQLLLSSIYAGYLEKGAIFETYDCTKSGTGSRGTYGTTIGVALYLLDKWSTVVRLQEGQSSILL